MSAGSVAEMESEGRMIWECARKTRVPSDQSHGATLNESVSRTCAAEGLATTLLLRWFLCVAFGVGVVYRSTRACNMTRSEGPDMNADG